MFEEANGDEMAACLRAARAYVLVDQEVVGQQLGVSAATVSRWERGKVRIPSVARPGVIQGLVDLGAPPRLFSGRETE